MCEAGGIRGIVQITRKISASGIELVQASAVGADPQVAVIVFIERANVVVRQ